MIYLIKLEKISPSSSHNCGCKLPNMSLQLWMHGFPEDISLDITHCSTCIITAGLYTEDQRLLGWHRAEPPRPAFFPTPARINLKFQFQFFAKHKIQREISLELTRVRNGIHYRLISKLNMSFIELITLQKQFRATKQPTAEMSFGDWIGRNSANIVISETWGFA